MASRFRPCGERAVDFRSAARLSNPDPAFSNEELSLDSPIKRPRLSLRLLPVAVLAGSLFAAWVEGAETVLLQLGSSMKYNVPTTAALGETWTATGFIDSSWTAGTYEIGYDTNNQIQVLLKTKVAAATLSVYTRAHFAIDDLAAVDTVWLGVDYDDGYIAWINGQEVARVNMPAGAVAFNTPASVEHESGHGPTAVYDPIRDITAVAKPHLVQGDNVLAIGIWNVNSTSSDLALLPYLSINRPVAPPGEIHWTLAGSPYTLTTTLDVPKGTVLTVDPGVTAHLAAGVGIKVEGQILAEGTATAPITFDRSGTSGDWAGITIDYGGDGTVRRSAVRFAKLLNATTIFTINATGTSEVLIEDCDIDDWTSLAVHWDNGCNALHINRCRMGMNTPVALQSHEIVNGYRSDALVEHCVFGPRVGYNDQVDLGNTSWGGPVPTVAYSEFYPGQDDAIDYDEMDGYIIGNFVHGHRPPPDGPKEPGCPQYPIGGGNVNGGGLTGNQGSRPWVEDNIIYDCYQGIGYKNGAEPTIINNTIVGCTWGVVLFSEKDIPNPALAHGTLVNNVFWDCQIPIKLSWCDADPKSTADVTYSLVPGGWPGTGNINASESPLAEVPDRANPKRDQFRLRSCSPAIDAGFAGMVTQPFHSEAVPALDAEGAARVDMVSVNDTGRGTATYYDLGALEYTGADTCTPPPPVFVRGEANHDGSLDVSDALEVLFVLYGGVATDCQDALDVNDDGKLDTTDAIRVLEYLFASGPQPAPPFPAAGVDPTEDSLDCQRTS
jgi:parallel beta-helix repeat protein